jgi:hypothetical protein
MAATTMTNGSKIDFRIVRFIEPIGLANALRRAGVQRDSNRFYYPAIALEAFLSISQIAVRLIDLVSLHAVALVGFVTSDNAASRCSQ